MDDDGKIDIIATRNQTLDIFILKNTSSLTSFTFATPFKITLPGNYNDLATADFDRDGKLDIVATSLFTADAQLLLNRTTASSFAFASPIQLSIGSGTTPQPFGIDVCDLNGDNFPDIIMSSRGVNSLNAFIHNTNTTTVGFSKVTITTNKNNWFVKAGDLDGDAKPDIAFTSFTNPSTFSVDILRNKNCHKPQIISASPIFICPGQTIRLKAIVIPGVTFDWKKNGVSVKNGPDPFLDITVADTYTVTAIGETGSCSVTSNSIVVNSGAGTLPADPTITAATPVCSGSAITLSTPLISGATYAWSGPNNFTSTAANAAIPAATIANSGIYSLVVKVGDCSSNIVTKQIDVVSFGNFSISSSVPSNTICQGQPLTLTVNSLSGYTFQWMKDGGNISGQTAANLSVTQAGSYKVLVTNTALGCSQQTTAVPVAIYAAPVATFNLAATGCINNVITFTNTSTVDANATAVYAWTFGDTNTSTVASPTNTYTTAQTFNPQLTVSYNGVTGCTNTATKSINIVAGTTPTITATLPEICVDQTLTSTLSVAGTFNSFLWSTTATTASIDVTSPGDFSVTTVDANGCNGTATITIATKPDCGLVVTELLFPVVFTPNGDSQNDRWVISGVDTKVDCTMNIFDGRGRRIFEKKGYPIEGWDGVSLEGKEIPQGTYYYVFGCPSESPRTGSVLVVR